MIAFFRDVVGELKKLHVPSKKETYITTITVLVSITIASLVILFADYIISTVIGKIFGL